MSKSVTNCKEYLQVGAGFTSLGRDELQPPVDYQFHPALMFSYQTSSGVGVSEKKSEGSPACHQPARLLWNIITCGIFFLNVISALPERLGDCRKFPGTSHTVLQS